MSGGKETPEKSGGIPDGSKVFWLLTGGGTGLGIAIWAIFAALSYAAAVWGNNRQFFAMVGTLGVLVAIGAYAFKSKGDSGGHGADHGHGHHEEKPKNQPKKAANDDKAAA